MYYNICILISQTIFFMKLIDWEKRATLRDLDFSKTVCSSLGTIFKVIFVMWNFWLPLF